MALAPCHAFFQFYVARTGGRLSCQLYQRSGRRLPRRAVQHRVVRAADPHGRPGDRPRGRRLRPHPRRRPPLLQPPRPGAAAAHPRAAAAAAAGARPVGDRARRVRPRAHRGRGLRPAPRHQGARLPSEPRRVVAGRGVRRQPGDRRPRPDPVAHPRRLRPLQGRDARPHPGDGPGAPTTRSAARCPGRRTIVVTRNPAWSRRRRRRRPLARRGARARADSATGTP